MIPGVYNFLLGGSKGPVITGLSPDPVGVGSTLTITGQNLLGTVSITIGGVPATSIVVVDNNTVTCTVPNSLGFNRVVILSTGAGNTDGSNTVDVYTPETILLLNGDTDWRPQDITGLNALFPAVRILAPVSDGLFIAPIAGPDLSRSTRGILYTNQVPSLHTMTVSGIVEADYSEAIGFTGDNSSYYDTGFDDVDLGITATSALMCVKVSNDGPGSVDEGLCGRSGSSWLWILVVDAAFNRGRGACLNFNILNINNGSTARWFADGREGTVHRFNLDSSFRTNTAGVLNTSTVHFTIGSSGSFACTRQFSGFAIGKVDASEANMNAFKAAFEAWETARAA